MEASLSERQAVLRRAAKAAGARLKSYFGETIEIQHKGEFDLVTQADKHAEQLVLAEIGRAFPDDAIIAEESGRKPGTSSWQWIIDPLDGTTNFASGFPHFCVSIAVAKEGEVQVGVVFDPVKDEWFEATCGSGAYLNGVRIQVRDQSQLGHALTATGFSYDRRQRLPCLLERVSRILTHTRGLRRLGSAALDLAYVACGRLDVFVEDGLNPWDVAAGQLLVTEAGGWVTDFDGQPMDLELGEVVACNPQLLKPSIARLV